MNNWRLNTATLWENDVNRHNKAMGVWGELKRDYVKIIEDLDNKRVKREEDPHLQNCLTKGHVAARRKVRSLIPSSPESWMPQPILTRDESQFLIEKLRYLVLTDISGVGVYRRGSTGWRPNTIRRTGSFKSPDVQCEHKERGIASLNTILSFGLYCIVPDLSKKLSLEWTSSSKESTPGGLAIGGPLPDLSKRGPPFKKWGKSITSTPWMAIMPVTSARHLEESSK